MSFYGYAERSADSQIDWSAIGKEVTTMLQTEVDRRDKLKSDINEASKKYAQDLMNSPTGLSEDVTKRTMELSEGASEIMLMQDRLLKTGQLKPKNYLTVRENLKTDTKTYYDLFKSFQDYYKLKMERMEKNDSSGLEPKLFAETEGFGAFNKSKVYINPVTGHITIGKTKMVKGPDGNEVQEMTGENFTVGEFKNFISNNIDRFDDVKAIDAVAKSIGEKVIGAYTLDKKLKSYVTKLIQSRTGEEFKALEDDLTPEQKAIAQNIQKDFNRQLNLEMQAVFSNDYNTSSFLGDAVKMDENGDMYDWAWDFEEGSDDENKILISKDLNSNFLKFNFESEKGKKQKERAINIFEDRVRLRLASSMTETGKQQYTPPVDPGDKQNAKTRDKVKTKVKAATNSFILDILFGNQDQKQRGFDILKNSSTNVDKYVIEKDPRDQEKYNIYALVPDKDSPTNQKRVDLISDANAKTPVQLASAIFSFADAGILNADIRSSFSPEYAQLFITNERAKEYGLETADKINPFAFDGTEMGSIETKTQKIPAKERKAVDTKGAEFDVGAKYDALIKTNPQNQKKGDIEKGIRNSFFSAPIKGSVKNNALREGVTIRVNEMTEENAEKIMSDRSKFFGIKNPFSSASRLMEIVLPPEIGPSFVLPIHSDYDYKALQKSMLFLADNKSIEWEKSNETTKPLVLDEFLSKLNKDQIETIKLYNEAYNKALESKNVKTDYPFLADRLNPLTKPKATTKSKKDRSKYNNPD